MRKRILFGELPMRLSIITVCLNSEKYIRNCIESVISQSAEDLEYIVIDGGSNDKTVKVIEEYQESIDYWTSEPDRGIADAMNKGIKQSNGEYLLFLNSDDYLLYPNVLEKALDNCNFCDDFYVFKVRYVRENGSHRLWQNPGFTLMTNFKMGPSHQGQLIRRDLFDRIGMLDTEFKIAMDYDFVLRAYRAGATAVPVNLELTAMRAIGISSRMDWKSLRIRFDEERRVHEKNCPSSAMEIIYRVYWPLYLGYRRLRCIVSA